MGGPRYRGRRTLGTSGGTGRGMENKVTELVNRVENVVLMESRWQENPIQAVRELLHALDELAAAQSSLSRSSSSNGGEDAGLSGSSSAAEWTEKWNAFEEWIDRSAEVDHGAVRGELFGQEGAGLVAERDIQAGELVLRVPGKLIVSADVALNDPELQKFIESDVLLRRIESLALSLCVLRERLAGKESSFKPYLDVLPVQFTIPLWFTAHEIQCLEGSPTLTKTMMRIRANARQYCHLYNALRLNSLNCLPLSQFSFTAFRWAVSVVMTRQNQIPSSSGDMLALVPLWDMINHAPGEYTTQFNRESRSVEFFAMQDVNKGDQIFMFYGPRPNSELLIYSGFVSADNSHDRLEVSFGLEDDPDDPLTKVRRVVFEKDCQPNSQQPLNGGAKVGNSWNGQLDVHGVPSGGLQAWSRVLSMSKDDINNCLRSESSLQGPEKPSFLSDEVEQRAKLRLCELFRAKLADYPAEGVANAATGNPESIHVQLCRQLCELEKGILHRAIDRLTA